MGLSRSLSVGASSLKAQQQRFDVISNNLANSNTVGYKSSRLNFAEQFSQVYTRGTAPESDSGGGMGGSNPIQFGLGVKAGSVQQDMSQGVIESTNRPLDMALQGDGFFVYNSNGVDKYSRGAAITLDRIGNLVDSNTGAYLQGYNIETDNNGRMLKNSDGSNRLDGVAGNMKIPVGIVSSPKQTQNVTVGGNLNSQGVTGDTRKTSINLHDQLGTPRSLGFTFTKTANQNEYSLDMSVDGVALPGTTTIIFNNDGTLNSPMSLSVTAADLNTALGNNVFDAATPKDITLQLADPNNLISGLTQFAASNTATFKEQDGYKSGELLDVSVDTEGKLWGAFSNGQSEIMGQVVVAKFSNEDGLIRNGDSYYIASPNSGLPVIGTAGEIFESTLVRGNSLEQSNVDLTSQFTDMISTQRAFEAASRTITLSDQLLQETNNLKR